MRQIKFLPDAGSMLKVEAPENLTVSQFIELLTAAGGQFDLEKNLLTEKKTKATYLTSDAVLADGDISLFSTIKDPKGNLTRNEIYAEIKSHIENDGLKAKEHFNQFGNYTRTSSDDLEELLSSYKPARRSAPTKTTAKKTTSKSTKVDPEEAELIAAQRSFSPKLNRR